MQYLEHVAVLAGGGRWLVPAAVVCHHSVLHAYMSADVCAPLLTSVSFLQVREVYERITEKEVVPVS
jgi:hypothetical protein